MSDSCVRVQMCVLENTLTVSSVSVLLLKFHTTPHARSQEDVFEIDVAPVHRLRTSTAAARVVGLGDIWAVPCTV